MIAAPILAVSSVHHRRRSAHTSDEIARFVVVDGKPPYEDNLIGALVKLGAKWRPCGWCRRPVLVLGKEDTCSHMDTKVTQTVPRVHMVVVRYCSLWCRQLDKELGS